MVVWHRIGGSIKCWILVSILRGWDIFFGLNCFYNKEKIVLLICPSSKLLKTMFKLTWHLNCCTKIIILNIPSFKTNSQGSWNRISEHKIQNITECSHSEQENHWKMSRPNVIHYLLLKKFLKEQSDCNFYIH